MKFSLFSSLLGFWKTDFSPLQQVLEQDSQAIDLILLALTCELYFLVHRNVPLPELYQACVAQVY